MKTCPNLRFLFVGDGILRESLEEMIYEAGLAGQVVFTGLVPPSQIPELVGAMDAVGACQPARGLARALPQSLIAGKPAISYDIDGAREVVITGETGFLLEPQSIEPMSDAMIQLASDAALRRRLGEEGRTRFTEQFRHQHMTTHLRRIYEEVLAARR